MEHTKLNILILEDSVEDAELAVYEVAKAGFALDSIRVDSIEDFKEKLFDFLPHIIISDYNLPDCNAIDAFKLVGEIDIPFIIVSGTVGEKNAVEALKMGVTDIVSKDSLSMLPLVIERALNEKKINRDKKAAEHELILNKERLELALEGTDMGVWDLDFMSNTIVYNNKSLSILGLSAEDAILDFNYFQEKSEGIDEEVVQAMRDVMEERVPNFDHEFPIRRQQDTSTRWVLARGKITRYAIDKRPLRASGTLIDITSRKLSEERLKKNQAILENAEAVARLGSFEWNSRRSTLVFSGEFKNIFEADGDISLMRLFIEKVHPQDQPYVKETILSKKKFYDIEHRLRFDEDRIKIVRNSGYITTDRNDKIVTIMGVVQDITEQREITRSIYNAQQDERSRMARDIHDGIGQMLVAARFKLSCIDIDPPELSSAKNEVEELLATTIEEVRRVSRNLANRHLEDFGLKKTLEYFVEETSSIGDFHLDAYIDLPDEYDLELSNTIYRIAQEALNNVIKYAKATNVSIAVETVRDNIILEVNDDGIGFDTETKWNGIKNMKERASLQNGHFEIDSVPGRGTIVKSWFPINN